MRAPYRPLASAGYAKRRNTAFTAGVCLSTTGLAGLPRFANVRAQDSMSVTRIGPVTMSSRRDGLAACRRGAKDSSLRCGGPVGAAGRMVRVGSENVFAASTPAVCWSV